MFKPKHNNPQGVETLVVNNLRNSVKNGYFGSVEDLNQEIDDIVSIIEKYREELIEDFERLEECEHSECQHTHYHRRNVMGEFNTVYERKCKSCGKLDTWTEPNNRQVLTRPDWVNEDESVERYYNNAI